MAEVPVQAIVSALADALAGITVAGGYNTDLGLNVRTERTETGLPTAPRCTVACTNKMRTEDGGQSRASGSRTLRGVIEFEVPASYANALGAVYAADEDIDRRLRRYHQMPDALPVQYEETVFLDRPDGMPVVAAEIHWSTGYRRSGDGA